MNSVLVTIAPAIEAFTSRYWPACKRRQRDDELGKVAERGVQEAADRIARPLRHRFRRPAQQRRQRNDGEHRKQEQERMPLRPDPFPHQHDGDENQQHNQGILPEACKRARLILLHLDASSETEPCVSGPEQRRHVSEPVEPARPYPEPAAALRLPVARGGAPEQEGAFSRVPAELRRRAGTQPAPPPPARPGAGNPPAPPAAADSPPTHVQPPSTSASPASGPKAMLCATARFSSTTGDGATARSRS